MDMYKRNRLEAHLKRAFRHFLWNCHEVGTK